MLEDRVLSEPYRVSMYSVWCGYYGRKLNSFQEQLSTDPTYCSVNHIINSNIIKFLLQNSKCSLSYYINESRSKCWDSSAVSSAFAVHTRSSTVHFVQCGFKRAAFDTHKRLLKSILNLKCASVSLGMGVWGCSVCVCLFFTQDKVGGTSSKMIWFKRYH